MRGRNARLNAQLKEAEGRLATRWDQLLTETRRSTELSQQLMRTTWALEEAEQAKNSAASAYNGTLILAEHNRRRAEEAEERLKASQQEQARLESAVAALEEELAQERAQNAVLGQRRARAAGRLIDRALTTDQADQAQRAAALAAMPLAAFTVPEITRWGAYPGRGPGYRFGNGPEVQDPVEHLQDRYGLTREEARKAVAEIDRAIKEEEAA
ncbi:hypothetical protein [Nocardiopsis halophila]|uniref:hypothetical protein n=1 Tax=Nocardiopsis halophila TaxID=141692 RepID=UPI0003476BE3|nr:hypothetical protein [Nocardiopsis halophila]